MGVFTSPTAQYIIKYFSNESDVAFENSIIIKSLDSRNKTNILIPANFTGKQLQVQVAFSLVEQQRASAPLLVGKSHIIYISTYCYNYAVGSS